MSDTSTTITSTDLGGWTSSFPTQTDIRLIIEKWQRKMNLYHWRITLSDELPSSQNAAEIIMYELKQEAFLRVDYDKLSAHGRIRTEQVIIHELVHILLNNLTVENKIQIKYGHQKNNQEYIDRFKRENEKVVEHMAQVLYYLDS